MRSNPVMTARKVARLGGRAAEARFWELASESSPSQIDHGIDIGAVRIQRVCGSTFCPLFFVTETSN